MGESEIIRPGHLIDQHLGYAGAMPVPVLHQPQLVAAGPLVGDRDAVNPVTLDTADANGNHRSVCG